MYGELGRQVLDKPQGRKPRGDQARRCGLFGLWVFEVGTLVMAHCGVGWVGNIWRAAILVGWVDDDFAVALTGVAGRSAGFRRP